MRTHKERVGKIAGLYGKRRVSSTVGSKSQRPYNPLSEQEWIVVRIR